MGACPWWGCGSAGTILVRRCLLVGELWALLGACDRRVSGIQRLRHLLTDHIHQAFKGLLDINVVLGAGLKKLKPCVGEWRDPREAI